MTEPLWSLDVHNGKAELMFGGHSADELFDLDAELLAALTVQVVYHDHDSTINMSGRYYPLSEKSRELFDRLMAKAKPKE